MRIGFIFAGTALIAFLPAFQLSAQSFDGPTAGFDLRVAPRIVLGAEARVDLAPTDALATLDPKGPSDFTARAGYLLDPATLAYVRGGHTTPASKRARALSSPRRTIIATAGRSAPESSARS